MERRVLVVQRDCPALLVPTGTPITIPANTFITLTQSLGGSYTVVVNGNMARVDGTDADALGLEALQFNFPAPSDDQVDIEQVWEVLRTIYDPEIPVSIVELGLIYACKVQREADRNIVRIKLTLTAPGCGMGPILIEDVRYRVALVPNVQDVLVELVFDPPWSRDKMSDEAKLELGMF